MTHPCFLGENPTFETWQGYARDFLHCGLAPQQIDWIATPESQQSLFKSGLSSTPPQKQEPVFRVAKSWVDEASVAFRHNDPRRFDVLYRLLWRLCHGERHLLGQSTDPDVIAFNRLIRGVRRDAYKIKAFLRFRETTQAGEPWFVAWIEPEYDSLPLTMPFFTERFANMRWAILTPKRCAHWDTEHLTLSNSPQGLAPPCEDRLEEAWLTYYASTFNPARIKVNAMLNAMPKKYWKTMPETRLIAPLLKEAPNRVAAMVALSQQLATPSSDPTQLPDHKCKFDF